jgi:hypothetical protein
MKKCAHCRQKKDTSEFHKDNRRTDGLRDSCKECIARMRRVNKAKNTGHFFSEREV